MRSIKIAEHINELNFRENNIAIADVDGKKICIGKYKNTYSAFAYKCPHASGLLADGFIDALGNIVCPVHHYKYNLQNGRNVSGEGFFLKTWAVEVREDGVFVDMKDDILF